MTLGSLLKNHYVIMIGVSVLLMYFMKKMPNMEELQQQEAEQMQQEKIEGQHHKQN
jgi:hypothetical protein